MPQVVRRWAALSTGGGHAAGVSGSCQILRHALPGFRPVMF